MNRPIIIFLGIFVFFPSLALGSLASDFKVNLQPIYSIPPRASQVLILDLTLPEIPRAIKILNQGTAQQWDIAKISIFEDDNSSGWDGGETEILRKSSSPFWDAELSGNFSQKRIFVTVDISSSAASERTIKPQLELNSVEFASGNKGPSDQTITGFERMILAGASVPTVPVAPLAGTPEAISTSTIRWRFTDLSNNEFGFKILDSSLKTAAKSETADISFLDETGLEPSTCYSGRRAVTFNDRGESGQSANFPEACTLAQPASVVEIAKEETPAPAPEEAVAPAPVGKPIAQMTVDELKTKIAEVQQKIIELLTQLIALIHAQIQELSARP